MGDNIQVIFPPAVEPNMTDFATRKGSTMHLTLDEYTEMDAFDDTSTKEIVDENDAILANYI